MPTATTTASRTRVSPAVRHFTRHYAEMLVAMVVGMVVLGIALTGVLELAGVDVTQMEDDPPAGVLLVMAINMSIPMAAWMRHRGHGWAPVHEMTASMFVPTFAAIALLAAGVVGDDGTAMVIQHAAMLPSMLVAMLLRLGEYTGHAGHAHAAA